MRGDEHLGDVATPPQSSRAPVPHRQPKGVESQCQVCTDTHGSNGIGAKGLLVIVGAPLIDGDRVRALLVLATAITDVEGNDVLLLPDLSWHMLELSVSKRKKKNTGQEQD